VDKLQKWRTKIREEHCDRMHVESKLRLKIRQLHETLVKADRDKKEVECALNGKIKGLQKELEEAYRVAREHKEYCDRRQQESRKVIDRLQEELEEATNKHHDTLDRIHIMMTKRIQDLERKAEEKKCERDLIRKLYISNTDVKEGESAVCGNMKKLLAAAVVMVVLLVMLVSFTNYRVIRG